MIPKLTIILFALARKQPPTIDFAFVLGLLGYHFLGMPYGRVYATLEWLG